MAGIRFAPSGGISIAFDVVGEGPIDIVYVQGSSTHLDAMWELPQYRAFCERIGEFARLIRFDKRGMGLSDRVPGATTLETRMDDISAVMDAVGSEKASIIGESEGGPLAMLFAAAHPERTQALILQGAEVRERTDDEWPWGELTPAEFEEAMAALPGRWGDGRGFGRLVPSVGDTAWGRAWFGKVQRNAGTPASIEAFARMAFDIDVRDVAPSIAVPTLIFHAVDDQVCHVENARFLARTVPGARYVEHEGGDHVPWFQDADTFVGAVHEFLTGQRAPVAPDRVLATVLFADIVDSTGRAAALGDRRWRQELESFRQTIDGVLVDHGGVLVDIAGDGLLATFDGPARAIRAAQALGRGVAVHGLHVRSGVHTGEVERVGDDVAGIAVHVGARIGAVAGPDEVWVSSTVRDLTAGSGILYEDRGDHSLKGVPGSWHLYSVA